MAATMLLLNMPVPSNFQAWRIRDEVQTLLQVVVAQQAKSSASRRRGAATEKRVEPARNEREVSVHQRAPPRGRKTAPIQENLVNNQQRHDARHDINEYRRRWHGDAEERGYSAHRGARTTATRTEWLQNHWALEASAEQSAARRCPVRSDPRPALPNTMVKPSPSCG